VTSCLLSRRSPSLSLASMRRNSHPITRCRRVPHFVDRAQWTVFLPHRGSFPPTHAKYVTVSEVVTLGYASTFSRNREDRHVGRLTLAASASAG
jgi:hypothetical protein